jgi:hypothetical protein
MSRRSIERETHGTPSVRQLPEEAHIQMIGTRQGLIHALIKVRQEIIRHHPDARKIPAHHKAKRRAALEKVDVLRQVEQALDDSQHACAVVMHGHDALKRGRSAIKLSDVGHG